MYASPAREHERTELEKARLELELGALVARDCKVGHVTQGPYSTGVVQAGSLCLSQ